MKTGVRRILVPVDPSVYTGAATETACRIALKHEAQVAGVAVLDSPEIRSGSVSAIGPYYPSSMDEIRAKVTHAEKILAECKARFAMTCEEYGVPHLETEYEGIPAQRFFASSIFFDLVVTGLETAFHFETRGEKCNCLSEILDTTVTPTLAVPIMGMPKLEKVLVAFDGSFSSARALRDFVEFARPYNPEIKVLTASEKAVQCDFLLRNAKEYLRVHGLSRVEIVGSDAPVFDAVEAFAGEDVDLVVAGIHSKKKIRDLFVGSFTKQLIESGNKAVFLSH